MKQSLLLSALLAVSMSVYAANESPCTLSIDSPEAFAQWTSIDANADGDPYLWVYSASNEGALYSENKSGAANDWLISPAVNLTAGDTYKVTVLIQNLSNYSSDKQKFELTAGLSASVEAQSSVVYKDESFTKTTRPVERSGNFTATETAAYHFGIHQYSASYMGNCLVKSISIEKVLTYPGAATGLAIEAAPQGALQAELQWTWPALNNMGGALSEITGANIYRASTSSALTATATYLAGTLNLDTPAAPGTAASWTDSSITEAGKYYYMVVPFNANGVSPSTPTKVQSPWIGPDKPSNVSNVVAEPDPADDRTALLTFTLPTGSNGGYLDLEKVSYKITRTSGSGTTVTVADSWQGDFPFIDSTIPGLDTYYYTVTTVYEGSTSFGGVKSNTITLGGTLPLPYTNTFDNTSSIALFTLLNAGNGSRNWGISSGKLNYWGAGTNVDAYAILPPFALEPGHAYKITFDTYVTNASNPKNLMVCLGTEPTAEALSTSLFDETISSGSTSTKEVTFSVENAGNFYLAFRCYGNISGSNDLYVDNLKIEEIIAAPLAVTDLSVAAGTNGALQADLSWVNPSMTNAGTELSSITSIEIRRGNEVISTLSDLQPGVSMTFTDSDIQTPGLYSYTLTPYLNASAGATASATSPWIGLDTPKAPANVVAALEEDGSRSISFDAVSEGVNGGYIDLASLKYVIYRNGDVIARVSESPYIDAVDNLELASYTYGVAAEVSDDILSSVTEAAPIVFGAALNLPYELDLSTPDDASLWTFTNPTNPTSNWSYNASKSSIQYSSINAGGWAITPPLNMLAGKVKAVAGFSAYNNRFPEHVEIYLLNSTDDLDSAVLLGEANPDNQWVNNTEVEIAIEKQGTYHLGFYMPQSAAMYCYLVGLEVTQTEVTVGVDAVASEATDLYYDAATATLYCNDSDRLVIYSAAGAVVASSSEGSISVAHLPSAIYIAVAISPEGTHTSIKFVSQ